MCGFYSHADTRIELPERGVVLVTGPNGSGKSSMVEAVGQCYWNKVVRHKGHHGWDPRGGKVTVATDMVRATRARKGDRGSLQWNELGQKGTDYETPSKAQTPLEMRVGNFEIWKRSCVFSAASMSHFTTAAPAERQRYLEMVFGLEHCDEAAERAKIRRGIGNSETGNCSTQLAEIEREIKHLHDRVRDAEAVLAHEQAASPPENTNDRIAEIGVAMSKLDRETREKLTAIMQCNSAAAVQQTKVDQHTKWREQISADKCPTCEQTVPAELRERIDAEIRDLLQDIDSVKRTAAKRSSDLTAECEELKRRKQSLLAEQQSLAASKRLWDAGRAERERKQRLLEDSDIKIAEMETAREALEETLETKTIEAKTWEAVCRVLGVQGVRAHILTEALEGIETIANQWLERFCGQQYRLTLSPSRETKKGSVVNGVTLSIEGVAGNHGYWDCSTGQQKRIDLALLFANAEVAANASGQEPGTLFIDEASDGLDAEGMDAFVSVLRELAQDRCVVVISHREDLVTTLQPDAHLKVQDGSVAWA